MGSSSSWRIPALILVVTCPLFVQPAPGQAPTSSFDNDSAFFHSLSLKSACAWTTVGEEESGQPGLFGADSANRVVQLLSSPDRKWVLARSSHGISIFSAVPSLSLALRVPAEQVSGDLGVASCFSTDSGHVRMPGKGGDWSYWEVDREGWKLVPNQRVPCDWDSPSSSVAGLVSGSTLAERRSVASAVSSSGARLMFSSESDLRTWLCEASQTKESPRNFQPVLGVPGTVSCLAFLSETRVLVGDWAGRVGEVELEGLFAERDVSIAGELIKWAPARKVTPHPSVAHTQSVGPDSLAITITNTSSYPAHCVELRLEGLAQPVACGTIGPGESVTRTLPGIRGVAVQCFDQFGRKLN